MMAADLPPQAAYPPMTMQCVVSAAAEYSLPRTLVVAILATEGGHVGAVRRNTNGTLDHGPMQINTVEAKELFAYGISQQQLIWDGCVNARAGARILRKRINEARGNFWKGVAAYHSKTPSVGRKYLNRVWTVIRKISANPQLEWDYVAKSSTPKWRVYGS